MPKIDDALPRTQGPAEQTLQARFMHGVTLHKQAKLSEAERLFEQVLRQEPNHFGALHLLGIILCQTRRTRRGADLIKRAIEVNGTVAAAHNDLGNALFDMQFLEEALASYERAIGLKPDVALGYCNRGHVLLDLKRPVEALASYDRAIALNSGYVEAHSGRGNALRDLNRSKEALASYNDSIALKADFAEAYNNRGNTLLDLNLAEQALSSFDKAIKFRPNVPLPYANRGNALLKLKRAEEALESYNKALAIEPKLAEAWLGIGNCFFELDRHDDAFAAYDKALGLKPTLAKAWFGRGNVFYDLSRYDEAAVSYDKAIGLNPNLAEAWVGRGNVFLEFKRHDVATYAYDKALECNPRLEGAWLGRGNVFSDLGRYDEAFAAYDKAIKHKPDFAEAWLSRGALHKQLMQLDAAIYNYDKAIFCRNEFAEAYFNKSLVLLLLGDFKLGWPLLEWRWSIRHGRLRKGHTTKRLWLGKESLAGKTILLYGEQGLGDVIQFCRYAKLVSDLGARVILEVPKPLMNILISLSGVDQLIETGHPAPSFDYQCPLMSLPLAFSTNLSTIPNTNPYLKSDAEKVRWWKHKLNEKNRLRVGLVWSGGFRPNQPEVWSVNKRRNVPLAKFAGLMDPKIEFYSLQIGDPARSELTDLIHDNWSGPHISDFTDQLEDFSDTAALIENLDLVISVDTSTAHLAGALGKPVWVLNRFDNDWRWLLERSDSPWYPSVKLYRQKMVGDWDDVIQRVKTDLMRMIDNS